MIFKRRSMLKSRMGQPIIVQRFHEIGVNLSFVSNLENSNTCALRGVSGHCVLSWKPSFSFIVCWFFGSVKFSHSVVSDSLWSLGPQHARPLYPSLTPRVYPNSCPLSQWCHPTILPSVVPFSSCLQSFAASGSFQMSQLFASGGQSIEVLASTSVLLRHFLSGLISFRID